MFSYKPKVNILTTGRTKNIKPGKKIRFVSIAILLFLFNLSCEEIVASKESSGNQAGYCLTFDDYFVPQWGTIKDILKDNDVNATFFITRIFLLSEHDIETIHELKEQGNEIGCHSWNHLNAIAFLQNHSIQEYINAEVTPAIQYMKKLNLSPTSFAYPSGFHTDSLDAELLKYFQILRSVTDTQRQPLTKNVEDIDEVYFNFDKSRVVSGLGIDNNFKISIDQIAKAMQRCKDRNEVIVFYAHCPVDSVTGVYQINKQFLKDVITLAKSFGLKSYRISDLVAKSPLTIF